MWNSICAELFGFLQCITYMGVSRPFLFIESTDSMICVSCVCVCVYASVCAYRTYTIQ